MKTLLMTFTGVCTLWLSCTNPCGDMCGGTGTETINTYAILPDGQPAAGAVAKLIEARWWIDSVHRGSSPVVMQAVADDKGRITLKYPSSARYINLQVDHEKGGALLRVPQSGCSGESIDSVHLQSYAVCSGSCESLSSTTRVLLAGTNYESSVTGGGIFSFEKVAAGSYVALGMNGINLPEITGRLSLTLEAGSTQSGRVLPSTEDRILIDDFENGVGPTSLGGIVPGLGWYVLSDSLYYRWDPDLALWVRDKSKILARSRIYHDSTDDGNGGKAFTFSTVLDDSYFANAVAGFSLRPLRKEGIDLSPMTGFSFRASGEGRMRVRFETERLDNISYVDHYTYLLTLADSMKTYDIPADSLRMLSLETYESVYPWKSVSKNVIRIEFQFSPAENGHSDSLHVTLDDFYLEGVSLMSLFRDSP